MRSVLGPVGTPSTKHQRRGAALDARRLEAGLRRDPATDGPALLRALAPLLVGVHTVASYISIGSEPSTEVIHAALLAAGVQVLAPVLQPDGDLGWAVHTGALVPAGRGLQQPAGPDLGRDALAAAQIVLVPALAVDRRGVRLGRGGGSYDRALPRARALTIALLHDGELVDALPSEPHDIRVDAAATPSGGVIRLPDGMDR